MQNPYEFEREPGYDYCVLQGRTDRDGFTHASICFYHGADARPYASESYDMISFKEMQVHLEALTNAGWVQVAGIVGLGERDELYRILRRPPADN